jgi:hypothetical protein
MEILIKILAYLLLFFSFSLTNVILIGGRISKSVLTISVSFFCILITLLVLLIIAFIFRRRKSMSKKGFRAISISISGIIKIIPIFFMSGLFFSFLLYGSFFDKSFFGVAIFLFFFLVVPSYFLHYRLNDIFVNDSMIIVDSIFEQEAFERKQLLSIEKLFLSRYVIRYKLGDSIRKRTFVMGHKNDIKLLMSPASPSSQAR